MEKDVVEYLDAWPPPENRLRVENSDNLLLPSESSSLSATISSGSPPPLKRLKYEPASPCGGGPDSESSNCIEKHSFGEKFCVNLQKQLSREDLHIVHCDYSVSADALLARWWKMTMSQRSAADHMTGTAGPAEEERVVFIIKSNAGPQTQVYHISRYFACHTEVNTCTCTCKKKRFANRIDVPLKFAAMCLPPLERNPEINPEYVCVARRFIQFYYCLSLGTRVTCI
jgi:hypothetical protein